MTTPSEPARFVIALRWLARLWGSVALLILAALFVEHLEEWFLNPHALPPRSVFAAQACHLVLLLGLAVAWRAELVGAGLVLVGASGFFAAVGLDLDVLPFLAATSFPAVPWLACALAARRSATSRARA